MSGKRLVWDQTGDRLYETGVDRGVLYPQVSGAYPTGTAWNGLSKVSESPSGADATAVYANNKKYLNLIADEQFAGTISAYTYPDEFKKCNGEEEIFDGVTVGQQIRQPFGFSYRTLIGNDEEGTAHGYKIHLVYGATAAPSSADRSSVNESPEALEMSWEFSTVPVEVEGMKKPTAHLVIDSLKTDAAALKAIEDVLYGSESADARLPLPGEVLSLMKAAKANQLPA